MEKTKQKMSRKKFLLILVPLMVLLLGLVISITAVMNGFPTVMNNIFGRPPVFVTPMENTETWDSDYYGKAGGSKKDADAAAEVLAVRAMEEGAVLLKNNNKALPLVASATSPMTVNAFGWSFYYPVNGGAGAGAIGDKELVSPEDALKGVGININQSLKTAYLDWTAANCSQWGAREPARPTVSLGATLAHWDVPELNDPTAAYDASGAANNNTSIVWLG